MRTALIIFILGFMLVLGACSDKSDDDKFDHVICPESLCGCSVECNIDYYPTIIQGSIIDQSSGEIIENVTLEFFEGSDLSTNICNIDGGSVSSITVTDGSFQVATCSDIASVTVVASADGYLDKVANVNLDSSYSGYSEINLVTIPIKMVPVLPFYRCIEDYISMPTVTEDIIISTDVLVDVDTFDVLDTAAGFVEIYIPEGVVLQDENGYPVDLSSLCIEASYFESNGLDELSFQGEPVSIASLIPEGLNADQTTDEVLVPIGVAEITMTSDDGTQIKNFSQPITITINLPEDTEVPSQGRNVQAGDQFTVRSFDSDTLVWTTEENPATVGAAQNGLYPASLEVDHLTFFALADPVAACNSPIEFYMTGDTVPKSGLIMLISSDYMEESLTFNSYSVAISAEEAWYSGFIADVNELYHVKVTDYNDNTWYKSDGGLSLCGNSIPLTLTNPALQTVDETLTVNLVCSQDSSVFAPVENGVVTYSNDENSIQLIAAETSPGVYSLTELDYSLSTYLVTIHTRTDVGFIITTVVPDGIDESYDVEVDCSLATEVGSN